MKFPSRKFLIRLFRSCTPRFRSGALALAVGALAFAGSLTWTGKSLAGGCVTPTVDGNIDDLKSYAQCIEASNLGCGLTQTDPSMDVCKFDALIRSCPVPVTCTGGSGEYFINGYDITDAALAYNKTSHDLFLGFRAAGIIGDSDGDGTPNEAAPGSCANSGENIRDDAGIGANSESYQWFIDTNCDGTPDITVIAAGNVSPGVPTVRVLDSNGNAIPGASATGSYAGHDIEVHVTGLTLPAFFSFSGFAGSVTDGLGEDAVQPIQCPPPSLGIAIDKAAGRSAICPGDTTHFFISVHNTGSGDETVHLTDQLPSGLTYDNDLGGSCSPSVASNSGGLITFNDFPLAAGATCTVSFRVRAATTCSGDQVNSATAIGSFDPGPGGLGCPVTIDPARAQASATVSCLSGPCVTNVHCTVPSAACSGTSITVKGFATNCGDVNASVTIVLTGPGGEIGRQTFSDVPPNTERELDVPVNFTCTPGTPVTYSVSATATNSCGTSQPGTNTCQVDCLQPQIRLAKTAPSTAQAGGTVHYKLTVTNPSTTVDLERVALVDTLCSNVNSPTNFTGTCPGAANATVSGNVISWPTFNLAHGTNCTFEFDVTLTTCASCENRASVTGFCGDASATANASATTTCTTTVGKCWLTGGGQSFDSDGHLHSYGGVVNPGCSPTAAGGGNWNDLDHTTGAHFKGLTIVVDQCGNVGPPVPDGSTSPKTPFNFIEFHGTGTFISGHGNKRVAVCFNGHYEDRAEPGSLGQTNPDAKDRYFLRVYTDCSNPVGSTVLLVDVDGNPGTQDPATIFHGNLQLHISGCDKAAAPGQASSLDDPGVDVPGLDVSSLPTELSFGLPRPNPTGTGMTLQYSLPKAALVSAKVFDVAGRVVRSLGDGPVEAGVHMLSWDLQNDSGQRVSPGLFFVRLAVDGQIQMRQVTVLP